MAILLSDLLARLSGVTGSGTSFMALCPYHDDHHPSLSVRQSDDGAIHLKCFAGCERHDILAALNMAPADLFSAQPATKPGVIQEFKFETTI